jgi:predicted DNA-binding ribbon-helix-helix protein
MVVTIASQRPLTIGGVGRQAMKSPVIKRSIDIAGRRTSVWLEDEFWTAFKEIAGGRDASLSELVGAIDKDRQHNNLSSAIRLFVLGYYQDHASGHEGETRAQLVA